MRSSLLEGKVRHRRAKPFTYALEHDVWYAALDVDELDTLAQRSRVLRRNRRAIASFHDADHLPERGSDVGAGIRAHLRSVGMDADAWSITLVSNLRILGYVFDPASFFLCRDTEGRLAAVVVEVHNTFGERHLYTLRPPEASDAAGERPFTATMPKDFYVSPFLDMDGRYAIHVRDEPAGLRLAIHERDGDGDPLLSTSLVLRRRPMTDRNLIRLLVRYPLVTHKTIGLIHWHALRLWLRGERFRRHRVGVRHGEAI
jgi:DUF1365 family protein